MEDYYEYLDSNGVTTLYKLIKDDTVALIDSYSVTLNGITTTLDTHINDSDIHTPITDIENMIGTAIGNLNYATPDYVDTKISGLVNSAPETLDTLKELSDALGNDTNFATTIVNQIGTKAAKDSVYTKQETDTLLEGKANSVHSHVVSNITDFPTIPTKLSQLENDMGFGTGGGSGDTSISWTNITDKPSFSDIAISGSYNDLVDTPNIPTKTSDLTNDSGYITSVNWGDITSKPVLSQVAISGSYSDLSGTPTIPTKTSQLINDSGFLTSSNGLITSVSWSDITNKPNFSTVATSGSYNDLSNKPTIPKVYNKTLTIQKNGTNVATFTSNSNTDVTADITVPTKVSELSNDSGFITGISWDKVTNKPTLATVATSGSYTDLSNTPNIPTKLSDLSNDSGFAIDNNVVHKSGDETITGSKKFSNQMYLGGGGTSYGLISAKDNNSILRLFGGTSPSTGANLDLYGEGLESGKFSLRARTSDKIIGLDGKVDGTLKWNGKNVALDDNLVHRSGDETIAGVKTFINAVHATSGNAFTAQYGSYTFLIRNDGSNTYFLMSDKDGVPGTWSTARPLTINNATGTCNISGNANSATKASYLDNYSLPGVNRIYLDWDTQVIGYVGLKVDNTTMGGLITTKSIGSQSVSSANSATYATTQATSDNSTKIATTAWVRNYVNSVVGSSAVSSSISAYYSNATTLTAEGSSSSLGGSFPSDYSDYINISPTVGTIYTGSQLFSSFTPTASGTISTFVYQTTAKATATFSGAFSSSAKYLCTTANAVKFRAYVSPGTSSTMGSPSVVDNSSAKSIFIRVQ